MQSFRNLCGMPFYEKVGYRQGDGLVPMIIRLQARHQRISPFASRPRDLYAAVSYTGPLYRKCLTVWALHFSPLTTTRLYRKRHTRIDVQKRYGVLEPRTAVNGRHRNVRSPQKLFSSMMRVFQYMM